MKLTMIMKNYLQQKLKEGLTNMENKMSNIWLLTKALKNDKEYNFIRKEAVIRFGFKDIALNNLVYWMISNYPEDFEEITCLSVDDEFSIDEEIEVNLLTDEEKAMFVEEKEVFDPNKIVGYKLADGATIPFDTGKDKRKKLFALVNKKEWEELGQAYKQGREEYGISLNKMASILGTSTSRLSNFEKGLPVQMSKHLQAAYDLALEVELLREINSNKTSTVDHVRIVHDGGELYIIYLVTNEGQRVHYRDMEELKWAQMVAKNKFAIPFRVPLILEMENGEEAELSLLDKIS